VTLLIRGYLAATGASLNTGMPNGGFRSICTGVEWGRSS
jgi:hypothetical protein